MHNNLAGVAFDLCCKGFSIIPLGDAGTASAKKPRIQWEPFQKEPACEAQVEEWWERWPNANIGIVTGHVSDLVVVDCDDQTAIDWHNDNCVGTPVMVQTGKGAHFYYKYPSGAGQAEWLKSLRKELQDAGLHIDLQADGRYVVAPGSVHENGKQYALQPADAMTFWEEDAVLEFGVVTSRPTISLADIDLTDVRASFGQIDKGARNDSLTRYAGALVAKGLTFQAVLEELTDHNRGMCNPPLKQREVVAIVSSVFKTHQRNHKSDNLSTNMDGVKVVVDDPLAKFSLPDEVVNPGGILQDIIEYTEASSVRTHRYFALAGAIALLGTLLGQKIRTETGLTTNVYTLAIGGSATGKDAPKRVLSKLLRQTADVYGGSDVASDVAILTVLQKKPRVCFVFDEVGMFLKATKNANSARAGVIKLLTEIYSCYDSPYIKNYANSENNKVIDWQALSIFGSSVPEEFYGALTDGESTNGFLARVLVFESTDAPGPRNESVRRDVPARLVNWLKDIWSIPGGETQPQTNEDGSIICASTVNPFCIVMDAEAAQLHRVSVSVYDARAVEASTRGDSAAASLLGRVAEHASKLALIHAASRAGASVVEDNVRKEDIAWAWQLAGLLTDRMLVQLQHSVHESDFEAWQQRITRAIIKHVAQAAAKGIEKPGASRHIIERALSGVPSRIVDEVLAKMVNQNRLRKIEGWKAPNARKGADLFCLVAEEEAE